MPQEINLNHICKIEGHANLTLKIENNQVKLCQLKANEGARFFEALVINRKIEDIQEIVSRICGICSCSHSVAAIQALEDALNIKPTKQQEIIRELLITGERIRSHATHLYFLALPDYYRKESALELGSEHKDKINTALSLIAIGNRIVEIFGGRDMHPFLKIKQSISTIDNKQILKELEDSKHLVLKTIDLFKSLDYPDFHRETEYLSLDNNSKKIVSSSSSFEQKDYKKYLAENIKEYATSKFVLKDGKHYMLGAIARINNNHEHLDNETKEKLNEILLKLKLKLPLKNPFYNNLCQAIELLNLINGSIELIKQINNKFEKTNNNNFKIKEGNGVSAIEAPRGILFHEYKINNEGIITYCNIITPTCQNLNMIEQDITQLVNQLLDTNSTKENIVKEIEKLIRAYDPCFSCSTHFLKVNWS